jgi:hypothetical protein
LIIAVGNEEAHNWFAVTPTTPRKPIVRAGQRYDFGVPEDALIDDELWDRTVSTFAMLPPVHRAPMLYALRLIAACPLSERIKIVREIGETIQAADVQDGIVVITA